MTTTNEGLDAEYGEYTDVDGWESLVAEFAGVNINATPLAPWAEGLRKLEHWQWGTVDFDRGDHYMFHPALEHLLGSSVAPVGLAVSHGGHGTNSYGVTVQLVTPKALVLAQAGWGGVYMDRVASAAAVSGMFASVAAFAAHAESLDLTPRERLVLALSDYRDRRSSGCVDLQATHELDVDVWMREHRSEAPSWMDRNFFDGHS